MVGSSLRFVACLVFAVALGAVAAGCKQGIGERCEVDTDCEDGNYCDRSAGDNSGGICKLTAGTSIPPSDSGAGGMDAAAETTTTDVAAEAAPETGGGDAAPDTTPDTTTEAGAETAADAPVETPSSDGAAADGG